MTAVARLALAAIALIATTAADDPGPYRLRTPIVAGDGSSVQRLPIPPAALAASRSRDLADIRVFDARGRAMPVARVAAAAVERSDRLTAMPILGAADALKVNGVSLQIDTAGSARIARVDGTVTAGGERSVLLGVLFDARTLSGEARTLTLDADVPVAQPVTFTVEASRDLASWRSLGEKVVYRATNDARFDTAVPLGMAGVSRDYLRVTWRLASRALSPVTLRQATLLGRPDAATALAWIDADLPPQKDPKAIEFAIPFATPIAALRLLPRGDDVLVPVRILGRNDSEHRWALLGQGVAAARAMDGIPLDGGAYRTVRIEADARSPGFTTPPAIAIGFAPQNILFLAAGAAPFTLAAGRPGDAGAYLPAAALTGQAAGQGIADARTTAVPERLSLADAADANRGMRQAMLWLVLLTATALLGGLAWLLWRKRPVDTA